MDLDREAFFAAIARHRRASWRVTVACAVAVVLLAFVVAILLAPLLFCVIGLSADIFNLATPTPDLMGYAGRMLDNTLSARTVSPSALIRLGALAAIPGLVLMAAAAYALQRVWTMSSLFDAGDLPGRPPDRTVLSEAQLANVVEEMAIAAGVPPPRVLIVPGGVNAAACGRDRAHVTLLVGEGVPAGLDREQMEGMIAHLVASIADGDTTLGLRVTTTLALFGLVARVGSSFNDRREFRRTAGLWRVLVAPTSAGTSALLAALADPFADAAPHERPARASGKDGGLTWREWLLMPLMGPVLLTGFLSGMLSAFLLRPLVSLAWRQRKYMADAAAVQLTRNPDALAGALAAVGERPQAVEGWAGHLAFAAGPRGQDGPFGEAVVPIFPPVDKRAAALVRMGAHIQPRARAHLPWPVVLIIAVLGAILFGLLSVVVYLLVMVSAAISGMFTVMPAGILHLFLRWLGRRTAILVMLGTFGSVRAPSGRFEETTL